MSFMQEDVYIGHTVLALTLGLEVFSWTMVTMTGRLCGPTTHLPHKDGGVSLSVLPKDTTSKLAGFYTIPILLSTKQGSCEYHFYGLLI